MIVVIGEGFGIAIVAEGDVGDDENLAEGEGDALAELIGGGERGFEPSGLAVRAMRRVPVGEAAAAAVSGAIGLDGRAVGGEREGQLSRNPSVDTGAGEAVDFGFGGAKGGLSEQARGVRGGGFGEDDGGSGGGSGEDGAAGALDEDAFNFAGGIIRGVDADGDVTRLQSIQERGAGVGAGWREGPPGAGNLALREVKDVIFAGPNGEVGGDLSGAEAGEGDVDRGDRATGAQQDRRGAGGGGSGGGAVGANRRDIES